MELWVIPVVLGQIWLRSSSKKVELVCEMQLADKE